MASTLAESAALAQDPTFLGRIQAAFCAVGVEVATEIYDPTSTLASVTLARRALYLNGVRDGFATAVQAMAWTVAAQPTITADSPDVNLTDAVKATWSAVAGA